MATFPTNPNLPAVTTATECDPDFFNEFVDNINAMALALIALIGGTADGNLDIDAAKGIKWGTVLKIYFSGGDIIIDDGVKITGSLDVEGTLNVDVIDDSGASQITINEDLLFAAGKYVDAPTGKFDTIDDSGAAVITINETIELASGKAIQTAGPAPVSLASGAAVTGNLDVSGTLTVDTINDSGASYITITEDLLLSAGKYIDAPTGKFDTIDDSGAAVISVLEDLELAAGKYIDAPTGKFDVIDDSGAAQITINETIVMGAGKKIQAAAFENLDLDDSVDISGSLDVAGGIFCNDLYDTGSGGIEIHDHITLSSGIRIEADEFRPSTKENYTISNESTDRSYDANASSVAELADVLATLILDLESIGLLNLS